MKTNWLLAASFVILTAFPGFTQEKTSIKIQKKSNPQREIAIAPVSVFKAKNTDGKKIKGRLIRATDLLIVYNQTDTLFYKDLLWIKAKRHLTQTQGFLTLAAFIVSTIYTFPLIPGSFMIYIFGGSPLIFMAPAATGAASVVTFKILSGKRFKLNKWRVHAETP